MMKQAVVTGARGFLGRNVARALAGEGWNVVGIGHGGWSSGESQSWGISDWRFAGITVDNLCSCGVDPDILIHCAGGGTIGYSLLHPMEDFERSVSTTLSVLEYARRYCPETRIAIPSSAAVYGMAARGPIGIKSPRRPVSPYGAHKKIVEDLCRSYARQYGLKIAIVRLFSVYGSGLEKQLLWDACLKMTSGIYAFSGTGQEVRDWISVKDAAVLLLRAAQNASVDVPVANGGTGIGLDIRSVLEMIGQYIGADSRVRFSGARRPGDPPYQQADIAEALGWGWRPTESFEENIKAYVSWFMAEERRVGFTARASGAASR